MTDYELKQMREGVRDTLSQIQYAVSHGMRRPVSPESLRRAQRLLSEVHETFERVIERED